jgi:hypothetical protein
MTHAALPAFIFLLFFSQSVFGVQQPFSVLPPARPYVSQPTLMTLNPNRQHKAVIDFDFYARRAGVMSLGGGEVLLSVFSAVLAADVIASQDLFGSLTLGGLLLGSISLSFGMRGLGHIKQGFDGRFMHGLPPVLQYVTGGTQCAGAAATGYISLLSIMAGDNFTMLFIGLPCVALTGLLAASGIYDIKNAYKRHMHDGLFSWKF